MVFNYGKLQLLFPTAGTGNGKDDYRENRKGKLVLLQKMRKESGEAEPRPEKIQVGSAGKSGKIVIVIQGNNRHCQQELEKAVSADFLVLL